MDDGDKIPRILINDLKNGNFRYTLHAQEQMKMRSIRAQDIIACAHTVQQIRFQEPRGTYIVDGLNFYGKRLCVVCGYDKDTLVITAYRKEEGRR